MSTLLNLVFPAGCVACGAPETYCCDRCLAELLPSGLDQPGTITLFAYRDKRTKRLIWLLKYKGIREIARLFAQAIYDRLLDEIAEVEMFHPDGEPWLVIPIPISTKRRRQRGFNQAEEIAKHLLRLNSRNFETGYEVLKRVKDIPSQVKTASRKNRWGNIEGAFAVADWATLGGRNVLLIDDVMTTGATIAEARQTLVAGGARRVLCVAVAHG